MYDKEIQQLLKEMGFSSSKEFHNLIANVDLSTSLKIKAFENWKESDGTKEGLMKLMDATL